MIVVRGAGDIATGTICRLHRCGFKILVLETDSPQAIRRTVSLAEAMYTGSQTVEKSTAVRVGSIDACESVWRSNQIPILVDPKAYSVKELRPQAVVDAILAKKNFGTTIDMANITIALGPGFTAGKDVHAVIETVRGHHLGRVIYDGEAQPNTGIPEPVAGYGTERVLYAPAPGTLSILHDIGELVKKDQPIATIDNHPVIAPFDGIIRGMIRNGSRITRNLKIADIDPRRSAQNYCHTVSDKARCISGGVLEALLSLKNYCDNR